MHNHYFSPVLDEGNLASSSSSLPPEQLPEWMNNDPVDCDEEEEEDDGDGLVDDDADDGAAQPSSSRFLGSVVNYHPRLAASPPNPLLYTGEQLPRSTVTLDDRLLLGGVEDHRSRPDEDQGEPAGAVAVGIYDDHVIHPPGSGGGGGVRKRIFIKKQPSSQALVGPAMDTKRGVGFSPTTGVVPVVRNARNFFILNANGESPAVRVIPAEVPRSVRPIVSLSGTVRSPLMKTTRIVPTFNNNTVCSRQQGAPLLLRLQSQAPTVISVNRTQQ